MKICLFFAHFYDEPFRNQQIFYNVSYFSCSDLGFESTFFFQFLVSSVDLRNFEDPDPGSQNLVDPSDPDPKHC